MVSWGKAYVWWIIGIITMISALILMALGGVGAIVTVLSTPSFLMNPSLYVGILFGAIAALIIGGAILFLGILATSLKYIAELVADEVTKKEERHSDPFDEVLEFSEQEKKEEYRSQYN